jgi:hypothetical protein
MFRMFRPTFIATVQGIFPRRFNVTCETFIVWLLRLIFPFILKSTKTLGYNSLQDIYYMPYTTQ